MGEARYLFGTKPGEDGQMYDLLDAFTTEMQAQVRECQSNMNKGPISQICLPLSSTMKLVPGECVLVVILHMGHLHSAA